MVSKNQTKLITSLYQKKYRNKYGLFIAEGLKVVNELINSGYEATEIYCSSKDLFKNTRADLHFISEKELKKISTLYTPNKVLALFKIPQPKEINKNALIVALDDIRDPGNLGTIIRLCDWFGIRDLVCSNETVDCFNPKVVQATMGSLSRININYLELTTFIKKANSTVFTTTMDGTSVYQEKLPSQGILVMGNESNGVSEKIEQLADHKIAIPRFGDFQKTESLNVATATAILLSEFKRQQN